jgi:hypothetical protein
LNIDNFNVATPGIIRVGWDDSSLEGVTLSDDEVLYELCFNTASNASGDFDIAFSGSPLPIEAVDVDGTIRVPSFSDGNIKIACDSTTNPVDTTISSAFNLALSGGVVECGEQICMDVRVEAFTNIIAFQYSMNWDPAVLGNASVQNFGIADISASNFNIEGPGILRAGWTEPNVEGMTLEAGTVLYQICFDAIGNTATNTPVQFTATPLAIEVMDGAGNIIETQFQEGNVSIECDMPVDTSGNENTDLTFSLSETTGDCADQVCMDVRVQNFKDILSFQYSINWDANLFGTASVQSFGMPDLGTSNFNTSTPGILRVGWDDVFITGVSLPDDHLIYQVCFDNISDSVKNAPINFSGTPTSVEVVNAQSNIVAPAFENGSLTITCNTDNGNGNGNGGNMGQSDLTFTLSEMTATCEEEVCMDVRVKGFRNILSLQYTINWDADLLGSANAQSFGLPDMGLANFNNNTPGILRIGWDDTFITGVSVPDDHVIFQLCFTDRQDSINATPVRFTDTPTSIEVVNRREELLIPIFEDGTVTVDCKSTALVDNDNDGFTNDVDCDDNNPIIYPGAHEFPNNAVDEDCDGVALFIDADNDGFNSSIDCDDNDPNINGNATEIPNNGIDEDCDGADLVTGPVDADNDGFNSDVDCDDNNPEINPSATEIANNGIDEDCDGADLVTGMVDNDNDGFNSDVDCDDNNPNINPSAAEIPNNEVDENCDGVALQIDADNDGFNSDIDCDDNNPNVNPSAAEVPNNAVDENCDGVALQIDADNDGFNSDVDCDDNNPNVNPSAAEIPNNEVDENCDGVALQIDADNDGFNSDVDCDDNNPEINPSATEIANNGIDEDCDGMDLMEGSPDDFGMILSSATASCGEQVCLKASVRNFKDIISFQYSINWDTTVLKYTGTQAYNLRGLNENAFFTPQNGVIRVSWFDVTVLGISAEDDAVIFEICFDVISNTSAMTNVEFSNNPIPIEVVDNQSGELAVSLTGGQVNVINCSGVIIGEVELPTMDTNNNFPLIHFQNGAKISLKENTTSPAVKAASFEVYPNPTQNILQIKRTTPFSEDATLRIYSTSGQLLKTKVVGKGTVQASVDLTDFSAGLYLIEIQEGNRFVRERVVKAR